MGAFDKKPEKKKDEGPKRPWRDNIEAITMAIIVAVMLKYFVVEAYKIPTGSMQPTLMGHKETGIFDRIIVDKLSYHYRDPERWEVTVFKYPLDRSKNFIKRCVGLPGESFRIFAGDLWTRAGDAEDWKVLRRPKTVQNETWKRIAPSDPRFAEWRVESTSQGWKADGRAKLSARGDGAAILPSDRGSVIDSYQDGYPGKLGQHVRKTFQPNEVGDLRLKGRVEALAGCMAVRFELHEGQKKYVFELPGPAAPDDSRPAIAVEAFDLNGQSAPVTVRTEEAWKLRAGKRTSFALQNMDDLLTLEVDGEDVLALEIDATTSQTSFFRIASIGEGADFTDLDVYRDIYYIDYGTGPWDIPEEHYIMLGDNTQDSSDSRLWTFESWRRTGSEDDTPLRANYIEAFDANLRHPVLVTGDPVLGSMIWLRDEWGELHVFPESQAEKIGFERVALVPRNLVTGRAVAVFWPHSPSLGVWRLKWIH